MRDLATVRQELIDTEFGHKLDEAGKPIKGTGKKRCRRYINECIQRIRQVFHWGVERQIVPSAVWHDLQSLRGIPIGRSGVRESGPVEAVPRGAVDAVLPLVPTPLRIAVELQWWTGMRAGEVLQLRTYDLIRGRDGWAFRPVEHKGC